MQVAETVHHRNCHPNTQRHRRPKEPPLTGLIEIGICADQLPDPLSRLVTAGNSTAHLRGYDVDSEEVRTVVLVTLLGSGGSAALKEAGIVIGNKSLHAVVTVMKIPGKVFIEINKKVGYRLFTKAGEKGVVNMTKLVPFTGAPIGAVADHLTTRSIATYAVKNFPPLPPPSNRGEGPLDDSIASPPS